MGRDTEHGCEEGNEVRIGPRREIARIWFEHDPFPNSAKSWDGKIVVWVDRQEVVYVKASRQQRHEGEGEYQRK